MKRILFFVHYNKNNNLSEYVIYLLKQIKKIYYRIVFISNSPISELNLEKLDNLYDSLILRDNLGFDFGAWKDALLEEGWDKLSEYDNLTLMNDTCFGPIFDLETTYIKMQSEHIDFWGLTNNKRGYKNIIKGITYKHIQSYFLCFNQNIIKSVVFQHFWQNIQYHKSIKKVINNYEIGLTRLLCKSGFKFNTLYTLNDSYSLKNNNHSFLRPDLIIENNIPFLKIKSFQHFPFQKYIINQLKEKTNYPINLINNHLSDILSPDESLQIFNKSFSAKTSDIRNFKFNIAIHIHVTNIDAFYQMINIIKIVRFNIDLYITIDDKEKINNMEIYNINKINNVNSHEIILLEKSSDNIIAWLKLSEKLKNYDIVGHLQTLDYSSNEEINNIILQQKYCELLINPIISILDCFQNNNNIGIIIPECPDIFQSWPYIFYDNIYNKSISNSLNKMWNQLSCNKKIDYGNMNTIIMPYGSMFWYRPTALLPILNKSNEIISEKHKYNFPINELIIRLVVYVAWNENYDYRIIYSENSLNNYFINSINFNNILIFIKTSKLLSVVYFFRFILRIIKRYLIKKNNIEI